MATLNTQVVRLPLFSQYSISGINGYQSFDFNLSMLRPIGGTFVLQFLNQYIGLFQRYRVLGGKLKIDVWNRSVKPCQVFTLIDGQDGSLVNSLSDYPNLVPAVKQTLVMTGETNPRSMCSFTHTFAANQIQRREAQNTVEQFLPWDNESPAFSVRFHYGSYLYDKTPGTFNQTVVITGHLDVELRDIRQDIEGSVQAITSVAK